MESWYFWTTNNQRSRLGIQRSPAELFCRRESKLLHVEQEAARRSRSDDRLLFRNGLLIGSVL